MTDRPARDALPPARKRLGQHFLTDRRSLERIAEAVGPLPGETVVEIGPGRGALTDLLAACAARDVVEGDVVSRHRAPRALVHGPWALVGNAVLHHDTHHLPGPAGAAPVAHGLPRAA
jgi:hypothetical protein